MRSATPAVGAEMYSAGFTCEVSGTNLVIQELEPVRALELPEVLPMTAPKNLRERMEFPLAFALSTVAGLLAFLLVRLLGILWEFYRG